MNAKSSILIVDDDESTCGALTLMFEKQGYEAQTAGTGAEALEKAKETFFNVALLDIGLPDASAVDLVAPLKEMHPDMAVIMVTGYASVETAVRALDEGASGYITKPPDMDRVLAIVGEALEKQCLVAEKWRVEDRLRYQANLLENVSDAIISTDLDFNIKSWNKAAESIYGFKGEEVIGRPVSEVTKTEYPYDRPEDVQQQFFENGFWKGEVIQRRKEGQVINIFASVSLVRDSAGNPVGAVAVNRDITERKRAREALQESEERYRELVENANDIIYSHDLEGNFTSVNPAATRMYGYTAEEVLQLNISQIVDAEYLPLAQQKIREKLQGAPRTRPYELLTYNKDGDPIWVEVSTRLVERDGWPVEVHGIARDITERKRAREALQRLMDFNESIVQNMAEGIVVDDAEGYITFVNPTAAALLGYITEELVGRHWKAIVPPDQHQILKAAQERRARGESDHYELQLVCKDGERIPILVSGSPRFEAGRFAGSLGVWMDITERKRAEEELRRSYDRLRRTLEQTVNALAAAVETRDPYTAGHQRGVAGLAVAIAREMALSDGQISALHMAGLVHDCGKMQVPAEILSKPTRLSEVEMMMIKTHPQAGYDILKTVDFPWPVCRIVLQHHERMDGSGYPQGLSREEILLEARILAVADVVEAMASHRPYRPAHAIDETLEEIRRNRGILYDPEVVEACLKLFMEQGFELR